MHSASLFIFRRRTFASSLQLIAFGSTLALLLCSVSTHAADTPPASNDPQTQLAAKLEASSVPGKVVWLEGPDHKTLAIFQPTTAPQPQGAVILVPDSGMTPDGESVIGPLRRKLTGFGWSTLALNVPAIFDSTAKVDSAALIKATQAALAAAEKFLAEKNLKPVIVIGIGLGATASAASINGQPAGLILISPQTGAKDDAAFYLPQTLSKLTLPILDVYGQRDAQPVLASAAERAAAKKLPAAGSTSSNYQQIMIPTADHNFSGQENLLAKRIVGWLRKHFLDTSKTNKK